jgi:phage FluMu gp28-like protein
MVDAGYRPDPWQRDLLRSDAPRVLMLTCRQAGKSTTAGFLALRDALALGGNTVLVVCPSQRQSAELVRRVADAVNRLGRPMRLVGESVLQLAFANGSRIIALPASESGIRCFTAGMVILDEAARLPESIIAAVRPMLAVSGGRLVALSTAFAKSGFFYGQWTGAERWERVRVTADESPRIEPEFLAEERRTLGERWYAMEYRCEFGDDIAAVFSTEDILRAVSANVAPLFATRRPGAVGNAGVKPLFAVGGRVMSTSAPEGPRYYSGLDLGQQQDFSALVVVERHTVPDPARE